MALCNILCLTGSSCLLISSRICVWISCVFLIGVGFLVFSCFVRWLLRHSQCLFPTVWGMILSLNFIDMVQNWFLLFSSLLQTLHQHFIGWSCFILRLLSVSVILSRRISRDSTFVCITHASTGVDLIEPLIIRNPLFCTMSSDSRFHWPQVVSRKLVYSVADRMYPSYKPLSVIYRSPCGAIVSF